MEKPYILELLKDSSELYSEKEFKLRVNGTSMSPFLRLGDDIFVKHIEPSLLSIGDVLVIVRENDIVTHRLIRILPDGYVCKGDNTHVPDPVVKAEQIFGKVVAINRAGERISMDDDPWALRNKLMGRLGNIEQLLYSFTSRLTHPLKKNIVGDHHISVGRIVFLPFRAIMRLISK